MAMQFILLTATQLLICLSIDMTESLQRDEHSASNLQSTSKNCTRPKPPTAGAMLKWQAGRDNNIFVPEEKAEFVCQDGFRQIGWLETLICQSNGNWSSRFSFEDDFKSSESTSLSGYCVTNHCNGTGTFNCTTNSESVDICKRCDCIADCGDGSDEVGCGSILINVTGRATGEMGYPENPNTPLYTGPMRCSRALWTEESDFYIKLLFTNFSLPEDCENNYVFLENATFSDDAFPSCCKKNEKVSCGFGAKSGAPPLSHSATNFMIITLVSKRSDSAAFTTKWFNVNGLFPFGALPKDDEPYPDSIKGEKTQSKKIENEATDSTYVAAVVIFSIVAFVVVAILTCKVGQHFVGPQGSVGNCCAWIAAKRNQRSPSRATSPEAAPIRREIFEFTQGRTGRITVQANDDPSTFRTRYGSADNVA